MGHRAARAGDDRELAYQRGVQECFDRVGEDAHRLGTITRWPLGASLDDDVRQRLELRAVAAALEVRARLGCVGERRLAGLL